MGLGFLQVRPRTSIPDRTDAAKHASDSVIGVCRTDPAHALAELLKLNTRDGGRGLQGTVGDFHATRLPEPNEFHRAVTASRDRFFA